MNEWTHGSTRSTRNVPDGQQSTSLNNFNRLDTLSCSVATRATSMRQPRHNTAKFRAYMHPLRTESKRDYAWTANATAVDSDGGDVPRCQRLESSARCLLVTNFSRERLSMVTCSLVRHDYGRSQRSKEGSGSPLAVATIHGCGPLNGKIFEKFRNGISERGVTNNPFTRNF